MRRMIDNYNAAVEAGTTAEAINTDSTQINWNRQLLRDLAARKHHLFDKDALRLSVYRPFCTQSVYFAREMNDMIYQLPQLFPTKAHINIAITIPSGPSAANFIPIMYTLIPALTPNGGNQTFPLYTWEPLSPTSGSEPDLFADLATASESQADGAATASSLDFSRPIGDQIPVILDGYRRVDNVTDATLASYREHYGDAGITKEDIFFYVYALLQHPGIASATRMI